MTSQPGDTLPVWGSPSYGQETMKQIPLAASPRPTRHKQPAAGLYLDLVPQIIGHSHQILCEAEMSRRWCSWINAAGSYGVHARFYALAACQVSDKKGRSLPSDPAPLMLPLDGSVPVTLRSAEARWREGAVGPQFLRG
ncbi:hypothetical protein SKAU_G00012300 [Synaphobranchus kaupii]|uniref:Uncharacterized protein n=1 Tax=Synaphobranchus kaupii TaxID=118154 RepID=A0A9Q1GAH1_SYNKA|nr:hypothetical protein SKAU_G00012300 [Synaphobranchus kaupii]